MRPVAINVPDPPPGPPPSELRVADFDYPLPAEAIAQRPASPRDAARLLVVGEELADRRVRDLPALLRPGDRLVINDTRVIPSRLAGRRGDAAVEVTLLTEEAPGVWRALARPGRKLRPGDRIAFAQDFAARIADKMADGSVLLNVALATADLFAALDRYGAPPLPPYIKRPDLSDPQDRADYQTIYATRPGAVAAPTAGLHFTPALFEALAAQGIGRTAITLHVGAGTFLPMKADRIADHVMHGEVGEITAAAAAGINAAREAGGRIVAVGTTVLRLLETAADPAGRIRPFAGTTDLFIAPGSPLRTAELLMTNFHLPRSTLLMLVSAFAGTERIRAAYAHALAAGYRFFSYGDATLLHRAACR